MQESDKSNFITSDNFLLPINRQRRSASMELVGHADVGGIHWREEISNCKPASSTMTAAITVIVVVVVLVVEALVAMGRARFRPIKVQVLTTNTPHGNRQKIHRVKKQQVFSAFFFFKFFHFFFFSFEGKK